MSKPILSDDTIITIGKGIALSRFIEYFEEATGKKMPGNEFQQWLNTQAGKSVKAAIEEYLEGTRRKDIKELMAEERFNIILDSDKAFIIAFSNEIEKIGYDFGGGIGEGYVWANFMIIYAKTGVKTKQVAARIYIADNRIVLRLFFNNVDKHRAYIENAAGHIRDVFTGNHGDCSCNPKKEGCRMRKTYTIDGRQIEKCSGVVFEFHNPTSEKLADYINLLKEFYPIKTKGAWQNEQVNEYASN